MSASAAVIGLILSATAAILFCSARPLVDVGPRVEMVPSPLHGQSLEAFPLSPSKQVNHLTRLFSVCFSHQNIVSILN